MKPGMKPTEYRVLVKPDPVERKTEGGIVLPESVAEQREMAQQKGSLVAVGGNAFEDWNGDIPKVGDRILFGKYKGFEAEGADGEKYRLCNDKDITAILEE